MASLPPPPPEGLNYTASIQSSFGLLMVVTPLASLLVPILILLFVFSTEQSRKHHVFYLNVLSILVGLVLAFLNGYTHYRTMVFPLVPFPVSIIMADIVLVLISPVFIDAILISRIVAFYPPRNRDWGLLCAVLLFPVAAKVVRFGLIVKYLVNLPGDNSVQIVAATSWPHNRYLISEWAIQMADNIYCTSFFFFKLREFYKGSGIPGLATYRSPTLLSRLRQLFMIALSNFVFPIILNICQIILNLTDPSYVHGTMILFANLYLNILMVVFATVWASGSAWGRRVATRDDSPLESAFGGRPGYLPPDSNDTQSRGKTSQNASHGVPNNSQISSRQLHLPSPIEVNIHQSSYEMSDVDSKTNSYGNHEASKYGGGLHEHAM